MSRLKKLVDKLFNVKPNEQVIKSLEGEVIISKDTSTEDFFKTIVKYISKENKNN